MAATEAQGDDGLLITTMPPRPAQVRLAAVVVGCLLAVLAATWPFAEIRLAATEPLLPAYAAAILITDLITAVLLFGLFAIERSRAILALATGYLFVAVLVAPWLVTFPGAFDVGTTEATAWIGAARRVGFPLFVLVYATIKDAEPAFPNSPVRGARLVAAACVATVALAALVVAVALANSALLPRLMRDDTRISPAWMVVASLAMALYALDLVLLWRRRRSLLDTWMIVVICTLAIELMLLSFLSSERLSLGWWAGRLCGLASASVILLVLLSETTTLYVRLARATIAARRARAERLTAVEAFSAAIAHEVNQPLASMVTNADAALRWLDRPRPDLGEAKGALERIVADGHRASQLVASIRAMFRSGVQARVPLDVSTLVADVLRCQQGEARLGHVSVRADLAPDLPLVVIEPIQLRQVVANLVANAIDAMAGITDRARIVFVRCQRLDAEVVVSVADSGPGLGPADRERVFEPFFTTKESGMGMGLAFCRTVIESHGGRIWAAANAPTGAVFAFALPVEAAR